MPWLCQGLLHSGQSRSVYNHVSTTFQRVRGIIPDQKFDETKPPIWGRRGCNLNSRDEVMAICPED